MPATDGKQISINLKVTTDGMSAGFAKAKSETKSWKDDTVGALQQVETETENINHLWRSMFEAFIGFEAVDMLKKLAVGAAEAANSLAVAARVAQNFGHSLNPEQFEAWLEAFARSAQGGGYAIDDMRKSVQEFTDLGLDTAQTQRAIADTANLAAARNISWAESTTILRAALTGHVEMLSRYGIISREAAKNIKTVEQAMEAVEKATAGAAAARNPLLVALGELGTAASLAADKLGTALAPIILTLADALTHAADAVSKIPQPILTAIASFVGLGVILTATALALPAITKGFGMMKAGLDLLMIPFAPLGRALLFARAGFLDLAGAELASMAPIALVIAAIVAVVVALDEIIRHTDHVKVAWHDFTQYLSDSFHEFTENFQRDHSVVMRLLESLGKGWSDAMTGQVWKLPGDIGNVANTAAPKTTAIEGPRLGADVGRMGGDIAGDIRKAIASVFGSALGGGVKIPGEKFDGTIPGSKGKDGGPAAAENALKNFEEALKSGLEAFADRVTDAQHQATKADIAVDQYKTGLPGGEPQNAEQAAELQKLVTAQIQAQAVLHDRLVAQQKAELSAEAALEKIAASISTHLKNHDELVRQATDAAREHLHTAQELGEKYLQIGVTVAKLKSDIRDIAAEGADHTRDAANDAGESGLAQRNANRDMTGEADGRQLAIDKARGRDTSPVSEEKVKLALDQLAVAAAVDAEAIKQEELARARVAYNLTGSLDDYKKLTEAQLALTNAITHANQVQDQQAADQAKFISDQNQKWDNFVDGLVNKINMPGLSAQGGNVSFNPLEMLMDAISKTQAFADVVNTATAIVNTIAQAFEAFRPIIDALLDVVRAVANVFIFMYNAVARILDLFGLQIQQLQYLTDAMSGLVPLINIIHEIPTLNELAAGKLNSPLSTQPVGNNTLGQSNGGQNMLMRVVEVLVGIFAAVVVEKVISGTTLANAVHQTAAMIGLNIGQKVAGVAAQTSVSLQTLGNGIATAGFAAVNVNLAAILLALQEQASAGIFQDIFKAGAGVATGGVGALAGMAAPMAQLSAGMAALSATMRGASDSVAVFGRNARDAANAIVALGQAARQSALGVGGGGSMNISTALSLDTGRRMGSNMYGMDRVPVQ